MLRHRAFPWSFSAETVPITSAQAAAGTSSSVIKDAFITSMITESRPPFLAAAPLQQGIPLMPRPRFIPGPWFWAARSTTVRHGLLRSVRMIRSRPWPHILSRTRARRPWRALPVPWLSGWRRTFLQMPFQVTRWLRKEKSCLSATWNLRRSRSMQYPAHRAMRLTPPIWRVQGLFPLPEV